MYHQRLCEHSLGQFRNLKIKICVSLGKKKEEKLHIIISHVSNYELGKLNLNVMCQKIQKFWIVTLFMCLTLSCFT